MGRRKPHFDPGEEVETPVVEEQLDAFPAPEQEAPVPETSDVLLKDHTHAGVAYAAGTPVRRRVASVTIPSVPSEPTNRRVRS